MYDSEAPNKLPEWQTSAEIDLKSIIFKSKRPGVLSHQHKDRHSIHKKTILYECDFLRQDMVEMLLRRLLVHIQSGQHILMSLL